MTAASTYKGLLLCYDRPELDFLKGSEIELSATDLIDYSLRAIGKNFRLRLYEEVITFQGKIVFKKNEKYVIRSEFPAARILAPEPVSFDPFSEEDWNIDQMVGNLYVYCEDDNRLVLDTNIIRYPRHFFIYEEKCSREVADFMASTLAMVLNSQQEWYVHIARQELPDHYEHIWDVPALKKLFEGSEDPEHGFEAYIQNACLRIGYSLTRAIPRLNELIEQSAMRRRGWDVFTYKVYNNNVVVTMLGDARLLDFEHRRLS